MNKEKNKNNLSLLFKIGATTTLLNLLAAFFGIFIATRYWLTAYIDFPAHILIYIVSTPYLIFSCVSAILIYRYLKSSKISLALNVFLSINILLFLFPVYFVIKSYVSGY